MNAMPAQNRPQSSPRLVVLPGDRTAADSRPAANDATAGFQPLAALVGACARIRQAKSIEAVRVTLVNEAIKITETPQAVLLESTRRGKPKMTAASSVSGLDRTSLTVRWLEGEIGPAFSGKLPVQQKLEVENSPEGSFPLDQANLLPLADRKGKVFGVLAILCSEPLNRHGEMLAAQLADAAAHAIAALRNPLTMVMPANRTLAISAFVAVATMFIPVPLAVLAPAEVLALDPVVMAAPMPGVIATVHVKPNQKIHTGDLLFSYEERELASELEIALRKAETAASRWRTVEQEALRAQSGARDLSESRAEYALAKAEMERAAELLAQTKVRATTDGVAVFSSADEWTGKPVQTGERIMQLADPLKAQFRVDLPVSDAIVLENGAGMRVFLDATPLRPVRATIQSRSYKATLSEAGTMVHELLALPDANGAEQLRIGLRGTAQVYSETVSLGFFLFRKPFSSLRQYMGI